RRLIQQGVAEPSDAELAAETERLLERDRIDSSRAVAPLRQANDAVELDTTNLTFEEQVDRIVSLALERRERAADEWTVGSLVPRGAARPAQGTSGAGGAAAPAGARPPRGAGGCGVGC